MTFHRLRGSANLHPVAPNYLVYFRSFSLDDISNAFPEIRARVGKCRYVDCAHVGERADECAIARAVLDGEIPESRVESYRSVWRTLKAKKGYN